MEGIRETETKKIVPSYTDELIGILKSNFEMDKDRDDFLRKKYEIDD